MKTKVYQLERIVNKEDASLLREYAKAVEKGAVVSYAMIIEFNGGDIEHSLVGPRKATLLGLVARLQQLMHNVWERS